MEDLPNRHERDFTALKSLSSALQDANLEELDFKGNCNGLPTHFDVEWVSKLRLLSVTHTLHRLSTPLQSLSLWPYAALNSPNLVSLSLSYSDDDLNIFESLLNSYSAEGGPPLRLKHLRLGYGCLPVFPPQVTATLDTRAPENYLDSFTDLAALEVLQLDNCERWRVNLASLRFNPQFELNPHLFSKAKNLRKIAVGRLTPGIVELIQLLTPYGKLVEIEARRWLQTREHLFEGALSSMPLEQTGLRWRKVLI